MLSVVVRVFGPTAILVVGLAVARGLEAGVLERGAVGVSGSRL